MYTLGQPKINESEDINCSVLNEYKQIYLESVKTIPSWRKMSQMELVEKYLEGGPYSESYLAAEILKFWHIIDRTLYKDKGLYDEYEVYTWYISAILYAIKNKPWENPKSSLYQDKKAIEKILNVFVKCQRVNWFQASNRQKRKLNHATLSIEELQEMYNDGFVSGNLIAETEFPFFKDLVFKFYNEKQYLMCFIIDIIVNDISIEKLENNNIVRLIIESIKSLPSNYVNSFCSTYNTNSEVITEALNVVNNMSPKKLQESIEIKLINLKALLKRENS